ncbi:MAG TPA: phage head closure protein [Terracidiphilus sp.]|nr:phage head closure protein [Terracidiphilus sp.]
MPNNPLFTDIGSLRHKVTIQAQDPAQCDAAGQPIPGAWTTVLTTRASIRSASAREQVSDGQLASQCVYIIMIRWPGAAVRIVTGQRVVFGGNSYHIQDVDNILQRNRVVKITAIQVDGDSL